ncbi:MAG: MutS family DNA mismatch repair protein, partial [Planctomycetota bacterium]
SRRSVGDLQILLDAARPLKSLAEETPINNSLAKRIFDRLLGDSETSAKQGLTELAGVARWVNLKQSAATFLPYIVLQSWFLWDIHALRRLERWQKKHGEFAEAWLTSLAELDALMSLAALIDDHPTWTEPVWQLAPATAHAAPSPPLVSSTAMGHPLLPESDRVDNDVTIGPPGSFLLVTGSNMSGKSTMLRSVGLNTCLAMAGGPICARELRLPAIELATSIRVADNLGDGVSYYMAELQRLAEVVDHAKQLAKSNQLTQLFLLDEILQGTNSRERQIAVARVLRHLSRCGSIGAITTHDLELADEPEMGERALPVHFRETVRPDADGNDRMTFDYRMRNGICPTTNALRLLELVGLQEDLP